MNDRDTIAAIATPAGVGGIGIVRVSGENALKIARTLFHPIMGHFTDFRPWVLHRGHVLTCSGVILDDALLVYMPAPSTYTGEPCVEFQCHGSMAILTAVLEAVLQTGARLADRGEFTRRAFLHGRLDLSQAEAVAEMVHAPSLQGTRMALTKLHGILGKRISALRERLEALRLQLCVSIDFPEEEVGSVADTLLLTEAQDVVLALETLLASFERTRIWREGLTVALAGPVNAGKSSLMNALLGRERAIVTPIPGTTRDFLEESVILDGIAARLVDTAGLRMTDELIEKEGMRLGQSRIQEADIILLLIDGCVGVTDTVFDYLQTIPQDRVVLVWNKADVASPPATWIQENMPPALARVTLSARTGEGIEELVKIVRRVATERLNIQEITADIIVPNMRQALNLQTAKNSLVLFIEAIQAGIPHDLATSHVDTASAALEAITGLNTPDEILNQIFEEFCIGK